MAKTEKILTVIFLLPLLLCSCTDPAAPEQPVFLVSVGETGISIQDFSSAFDLHKSAYAYDRIKEPAQAEEIRLQFLEQMIEKMIILERARELGIKLSDAETGKAVSEIQKSYPKGAFEQMLVENAVSFPAWKEELKTRLLLEKVIEKDIADKITVTDEDIEHFRARLQPKMKTKTDRKSAKQKQQENVPEKTPEMIAAIVKREKTEAAYEEWMKKLREKYTVTVNDEQWRKLADS
ncbi:MAG: SurA N-terminal domain-containing protein [Desulfococcaceae bacterium]